MVATVGLCGSHGAAAKSRRVLTPLRVELRIRVAHCKGDDKPVKDAAWVAAHIESANKIFAAHKVALTHKLDTFVPARCELITRADRHAMAVHVDRPAVTVLVMKRVQDVDVPTYDLKGVHWRYRGKTAAYQGRRWVLLTARARPPVLAHELGHYFGLPHDRKGGNLMTPGPSDAVYRRPKAERPAPWRPLLTRRQGRRLRAGVRAFARSIEGK